MAFHRLVLFALRTFLLLPYHLQDLCLLPLHWFCPQRCKAAFSRLSLLSSSTGTHYISFDRLLVSSTFVHNPVDVTAFTGFETGLRRGRTEVTNTFSVACKLIKNVIETIPSVCVAPLGKQGRWEKVRAGPQCTTEINFNEKNNAAYQTRKLQSVGNTVWKGFVLWCWD